MHPSVSVGTRVQSSSFVSSLHDVQYAVIVALRRRVGLEVVFDGSLVLDAKS